MAAVINAPVNATVRNLVSIFALLPSDPCLAAARLSNGRLCRLSDGTFKRRVSFRAAAHPFRSSQLPLVQPRRAPRLSKPQVPALHPAEPVIDRGGVDVGVRQIGLFDHVLDRGSQPIK